MGSRMCPHCRKDVPSSEMCDCDGAKAAQIKPISDAIERARMKTVLPSAALLAYASDLKAVIARHQHLSAMEMLAGASHLVGVLVALQDQTKITPRMAMDLVSQNIEKGNLEAISGLLNTEGAA